MYSLAPHRLDVTVCLGLSIKSYISFQATRPYSSPFLLLPGILPVPCLFEPLVVEVVLGGQ